MNVTAKYYITAGESMSNEETECKYVSTFVKRTTSKSRSLGATIFTKQMRFQ